MVALLSVVAVLRVSDVMDSAARYSTGFVGVVFRGFFCGSTLMVRLGSVALL